MASNNGSRDDEFSDATEEGSFGVFERRSATENGSFGDEPNIDQLSQATE